MSHPALATTDALPVRSPGSGAPLSRAVGVPERHLRMARAEPLDGAEASAVPCEGLRRDGDPTAYRGLYGATPAMHELFRKIERVGRTDVTVLVTGERGTGKALVARALHDASGRGARPFVALDCSAFPAELVERELFGHAPGASTGAEHDHAGLFEAAHGGTLFLDGIGDLSPLAQAKVMRALEHGDVMPARTTRTSPIDVRVIAATDRSLDDLVTTGRFRDDLKCRLEVISLALPPLRDRRDDIPLLVGHFLRLSAARHAVPVRRLSESARAILEQHDWPGNVRELRHVIESALVLGEGDAILPTDLPATLRRQDTALPITLAAQSLDMPFVEARERALREFDRAFLGAALARHDGNIARTARALGLHRQSLQKLLVRRDMRLGEPPRGR